MYAATVYWKPAAGIPGQTYRWRVNGADAGGGELAADVNMRVSQSDQLTINAGDFVEFSIASRSPDGAVSQPLIIDGHAPGLPPAPTDGKMSFRKIDASGGAHEALVSRLGIFLAVALLPSLALAQSIVGPDEVEAKHPAWFSIEADDTASAGWFPSEQLQTGPPHLRDGHALFWAAKPGKYVILALVVDWDARSWVPLRHVVTVTGQDDDDDDGDDDDDDGDDDNPTSELWGVIIEESSQRTADQAAVLTSRAVRVAFEEGRLRVADQHVVDRDGKPPAGLEDWLELAKPKPLPWLFLLGAEGVLLYQGPLPETVKDMLALVGKYQPKRARAPPPRPVAVREEKPAKPKFWRRACGPSGCRLVPVY